MDRTTAAIMIQSKNMGLAIVLTLLFGGIGLFYATIAGGIIMSILMIITLIIAFLTLGIGAILFIPLNIICIIWAVVAVNKHNKKLVDNISG